jgi:cell division protein ZapB
VIIIDTKTIQSNLSPRDRIINALHFIVARTIPLTGTYMVKNQFETQLDNVIVQLDTLLSAHTKLKLENESLKSQQDSLIEERAQLIEKNEQARSRVEAMITRLKVMESNQ